MTWLDALDIVVWATKHERYRWLCSEANEQPPPNDRESYRRLMVSQATGQPMAQPTISTITTHEIHARGCCG